MIDDVPIRILSENRQYQLLAARFNMAAMAALWFADESKVIQLDISIVTGHSATSEDITFDDSLRHVTVAVNAQQVNHMAHMQSILNQVAHHYQLPELRL